jgi:hypothetical protein
MTLTENAVTTATAQKSGNIVGNVDFFLYLLKMGSLSAKHSAQQSIPFLQSGDGSKENTIWFSKKLQEQYALKTADGLTAFSTLLSSQPREYDICIIDDGVKPASWCLYKKGENTAKTVATVTITDTTNAATVATVK